jgi:hypothetical protein
MEAMPMPKNSAAVMALDAQKNTNILYEASTLFVSHCVPIIKIKLIKIKLTWSILIKSK